jgi:hypothetical protein
LPAGEAGILFAHGLSSLCRTLLPSRSEEAPHGKELPSTDTPRPMPHALTVSMAGLRTCGSTPGAAFAVAQWLLCAWLAAYRSGGCRGFGQTRTAFPFHPQRGTITLDVCASSGRESKRFIEQGTVRGG